MGISTNSQRSETLLRIVSATYGPSEGRRLLTGELSNDRKACIPFTRDVGPFLKAILNLRKKEKTGTKPGNDLRLTVLDENGLDETLLITNRRGFLPLMDGKQMNIIFGDPCPGTSKRLEIHYITYELSNNQTSCRASKVSKFQRVINFSSSFAEYEPVVLRPRIPCYQDDTSLKQAIAAEIDKVGNCDESKDSKTLRKARKMGRAQSIAELAESKLGLSQTEKKWRLRSATSEITLPIVLPFLKLKERVRCKLVCKVWSLVIRDWGIAQTIDVNDDTTFPNFTVNILRGLLAHSHHSLQSLFLGDFHELTKEMLHPAIPFLRKLKHLDISRCNNLDDSTLLLFSEHVYSTLEVFYLKGLRNVTDRGVISISQSCKKLAVLEISNISITDDCGISIGENLTNLKALYMRDNYLLTNRSVDVITQNCTQLLQLTLWGCTRLLHLSFQTHGQFTNNSLIALNLWGCHSLVDEVAEALGSMKSLRNLIVSECHRLTNAFLFGLSRGVPQLNHLHLRYCKKINDEGISCVTNSMRQLYSLDLSFCSRVTAEGILHLLQVRQDSLAELRLMSCSHLDITRDLRHHNEFLGNFSGDGQAGRAILASLRSLDNSNLSMLDLRNCGGYQVDKGYPDDDVFVQGLVTLGFKQMIPGFFRKSTRANYDLYKCLVEQLSCQSAEENGTQ